jgi:hypothetical protein
MFSSQARPRTTKCKCCNQSAVLFDVCDFNKNCEEQNGKFLELSGIPIYYYKCSACGFIFTDEFDGWDHEDFKLTIYNEGYIEVDPDCVSVRPKANAGMISRIFIQYSGGWGK